MPQHADPADQPTTAQLRGDIDAGRGGDKVAGFDPAAVPLGTDDEAGGSAPTPSQIMRALRQETRMETGRANAADPALAPDGEKRRFGPAWSGAAAGAAAAIIVVAAAALMVVLH